MTPVGSFAAANLNVQGDKGKQIRHEDARRQGYDRARVAGYEGTEARGLTGICR